MIPVGPLVLRGTGGVVNIAHLLTDAPVRRRRSVARDRLHRAWLRRHADRSEEAWQEVLAAQQWFDELYGPVAVSR